MTEFEYDDEGTTSYFFVLALLVLYLMGATTWRICARYADADDDEDAGVEHRKLRKAKKATSIFNTWNIIYVTAWIVLALIIYKISSMEHEVLYDPFEILELSRDATTQQIRKKYRDLSLKYHPDKNVNDPNAEQIFVRISKAYRALTDPKTRENWEKYGNPDGPTSQTYGIALPSWMVEGKHSALVMLAYFVSFVILVPLCVRFRWSRSKKFFKQGILMDTTYRFLGHLKTDTLNHKALIEGLSIAEEFHEKLKPHASEREEILDLLRNIPELPSNPWAKGKLGFKHNAPFAVKARVLLHAHINRLQLSPALLQDLDYVLEKSPDLLHHMAEISFGGDKRWCKLACTALQTTQMVIQAVTDPERDELLQVPHADKDVVSFLNKKNIRTVRALLDRTDDQLRACFPKYNFEQLKNVLRFAEIFPLLDVTCSLPQIEGVNDDGSDTIVANSNWFITVSIKLVTREERLAELKASRKKRSKGTALSNALKSNQGTPSDSKRGRGKKGKKGMNGVNGKRRANDDSDLGLSDNEDEDASSQEGNGSDIEEDEEMAMWAGVKRPDEIDIDEQPGPVRVHCPRYPHPKDAEWWCFVSDTRGRAIISNLWKVKALGRKEVTQQVGIVPLPKGLHALKLHIICDSYLGVDLVLPLTVKAVPPVAVKQVVEETITHETEEPEYEEDSEDDEDDEL
eukprot:m.194586 g.194586  ORF g.194586 m.194586 type:complete len:686 (-) comp16795_c5_seq3:3148-5205(-)